MAGVSLYKQLPASADKQTIHPYIINIDEGEIKRMNTLIELSNIPAACYENAAPNRQYGITREWLAGMKQRWLSEFSWKQHEEHLNQFNNYKATVHTRSLSDSIDIHFVGLFSQRTNATPIILFHGWPGSFLEFLPIVQLVANKYTPSTLPYHLIVPSLPGYGISSPPPTDQNENMFGLETNAEIMDNLMSNIFGPIKYIAQGGDVGARVARIMAAQYPNCIAAHLNYSPLAKQPLPDSELHLEAMEQGGLERRAEFQRTAYAYAQEQATRPSTLGLVLASNPLALLAWIGEKFLEWPDPASFPYSHDDPSSPFADEILLSVSLYWLSGSITTTFYPYKEHVVKGKNHDHPDYHVHAPKQLGYSWFPKEIQAIPVSWVKTTGNLVWWKRHDIGGHFAAVEQTEVLWHDIEEFVGQVVHTK